MDILSLSKAWKWQVVYSFFFCSWGLVFGQLHYSVTEEVELGSVVGNVAQDLGLNLPDINNRRLHLGSEGSRKYFAISQANGALTVKERIDRESLCGSSSKCVLPVEIVAENPLELFSLEIEIVDKNDNFPTFSTKDHIIKITELLTSPGVRFPLEIAQDPDMGRNGVSQYKINPNPYFSLSVKTRKDGTIVPELVLERALDREEKQEHKIILTALDGGEPAKSGSCLITVTVLDINDNPPVFDKPIYKIKLLENAVIYTILISLNATDLDEGMNGEIEYYFDDHTSDSAKQLFELNSQTGEIYIKGLMDFEESNFYELSIKAKDKGMPELEGRCLIQVEIEDANDNPPEIILTSMSTYVSENAALETAVAFFSVRDKDSAKNGEVELTLSPHLPFKIKPFKNHYALVTDGLLDREKISQYSIQLVATDLGSPALKNKATITLNVSDVNDNPPVFEQSYYEAFIKENNNPGSLLCTVSATDLDEEMNAALTYSIVERQIDGSSVSSFVYINPQSGMIYAQRAFDYEQIQVFQVTVSVEDSGFPKLFSNITVFIFVLDENDNSPTLLHPKQSIEVNTGEQIQKSAPLGFLVTKISAVDLDSGHNAWLSFSIVEDTGPALFKVSASTGEIRTIKHFQETDNREQHLVVLITDHGELPLSTTVTIFINIVDNDKDESPKSQHFLINSKPPSNLTLYLIISLVAISLVFLVTFFILLVKCLKRENHDSSIGCCFLNRTPSSTYADQYKPALYLNTDGTLKYMEVRMVPPEPQCYQTCFQPTSKRPEIGLMDPHFPHLKNSENEFSSDKDWQKHTNQVRMNWFMMFSFLYCFFVIQDSI